MTLYAGRTPPPPLRKSPFEPDGQDELRAKWVMDEWDSQTLLLRQRDRQIEENVRMLLGQHWIVFSELYGRFVNLAEELNDDERQWRHMPVMNRLFLWYVLLHARMTENPPALSWLPGPDRIDAQLAEVMDPVFKYLWRESNMLSVIDRLAMWLIPSGRVHWKSRIDPSKGEVIRDVRPGRLRLLDAAGNPIATPSGEPIEREFDEVPYTEDEEPAAEGFLENGELVMGSKSPFEFMEGGLVVDVLTALEVRGEWGEHVPWEDKTWHQHRSLLTPEQAYDLFGEEIEPDIKGDLGQDVVTLYRLLFSSGVFGAANGAVDASNVFDAKQEFVTVYERWQKPGRFPGTERTLTSPGGRLTIVTGDGKVRRDGVRTAAFKYTSPIRCLDFVNLPGRPSGSSPQEQMNGPIRTRNRLTGQHVLHATRVSNPIRLIDEDSGLRAGDVPNIPGVDIGCSFGQSKVDPVRYVAPPQLGNDVYESIDRLRSEIDDIGSITGAMGEAPTTDASGELVKELRWNSDRPIGSTMRRFVVQMGYMAEDWKQLVPIMWDQEKVLEVAGVDGIYRTITVWSELFREGTVNVIPSIESMLPEGRGERQLRVKQMYLEGIFGPPGTPQAINSYLDQAQFPHMSQAHRPGGIDRTMAQQNVGSILKGLPAAAVHVFEWYDHGMHLYVLEQFLKGPEFLKVSPSVQQELVVYRENLLEAQAQVALKEAGRQLAVQTATQAAAAAAASAIAPPGATGGSPRSADGMGGPSKGSPSAASIPSAGAA